MEAQDVRHVQSSADINPRTAGSRLLHLAIRCTGSALSHVTLQTRDAFYEWSQLVQVYAGPRLKLWPSWRKVRDSLETAILFLSPFYDCTQLRYWLLPASLRAIPHCFSKRFRKGDSCNIYVSSQRHPWFASDSFKRHLWSKGRGNEWVDSKKCFTCESRLLNSSVL